MGILKPIDQSLVTYTPGAPEFEALVSDTLGDQGSETDGFEAAMAILTSTMPATEAALSALDLLTDDLDGAVAAFNAIDLTDLVADWSLGAPAIAMWHSNLVLRTIGVLGVPATPNPPGGDPLPSPVTCTPIPGAGDGTGPTPIPVPIIPPFPDEPCPSGFVKAPDGGCAPAASQDPYVTAGLKILLGTAALNLPAGVAIGSAAFGSSIGTMIFGSTAASIIGVIGSVTFGAILPLVILSWLGINPFSDAPSRETFESNVAGWVKLFTDVAATWGPAPRVPPPHNADTDSGLQHIAEMLVVMTPIGGDKYVREEAITAFTRVWDSLTQQKIYSVEQVAYTLGWLQSNWPWFGK